MELLAHSARAARKIVSQSYADHIAAVRATAGLSIEAALRYRTTQEPAFLATVDWASVFHDLGKLEPDNQNVLRTNECGHLPINHVDAGVAHLRAVGQGEAAVSVYGHHIGLCDLPTEFARDQQNGQDPAQAALRDYKIKLSTDTRLPELLSLHSSVVSHAPRAHSCFARKLTGLERRLLLSCLVDADHHDTAQHYGEEPYTHPADCRWGDRLDALDIYVRHLSQHGGPRAGLRSQVYQACRAVPSNRLIWACDSPVGSGKTTAIMAYLLQAAIALNLRHIIVVLPYVNIVRQAVEVYRKALVLLGEDAEKVVAAHHHQAEFDSPDLRYLTTLWDSPIIVTTAVQFFETLGTNQTARLRKLHQLPGTAVFIDEAHAAMPIHLWPYMWDQINQLAEDWSCRFVLGSGSLARFWGNPRILGESRASEVPSMIPAEIRLASSTFERARVRYLSQNETFSLSGICDWIQKHTGPRLVVMNTVQSAAVVARELRQRGVRTMHLSTALAPVHREIILSRIREDLRLNPNLDWVLVATSCIEAGVDLSFAVAFRERCRAASLVQVGGRVNRHGERSEGIVWDFIVNDPLLIPHPDFRHSRDVVEDLFRKNRWSEDITELMTYALEEEFKRCSGEVKIKELSDKEQQGAYPTVAQLTRLISSDTRLVVIDPTLISVLRQRKRIDRRVLLGHSVQLWATKIQNLALQPIGDKPELYAWEYGYDPQFLGIMEGILTQSQIEINGYAII